MVKCEVVVKDDEKTLEIRKLKNCDVVEVYLSEKMIFSGDWFGNIRKAIVKTMEWKDDR